jgi:hypothetical protein
MDVAAKTASVSTLFRVMLENPQLKVVEGVKRMFLTAILKWFPYQHDTGWGDILHLRSAPFLGASLNEETQHELQRLITEQITEEIQNGLISPMVADCMPLFDLVPVAVLFEFAIQSLNISSQGKGRRGKQVTGLHVHGDTTKWAAFLCELGKRDPRTEVFELTTMVLHSLIGRPEIRKGDQMFKVGYLNEVLRALSTNPLLDGAPLELRHAFVTGFVDVLCKNGLIHALGRNSNIFQTLRLPRTWQDDGSTLYELSVSAILTSMVRGCDSNIMDTSFVKCMVDTVRTAKGGNKRLVAIVTLAGCCQHAWWPTTFEELLASVR